MKSDAPAAQSHLEELDELCDALTGLVRLTHARHTVG